MRFRAVAIDLGFRSNMDLAVADFQPEPAAACERTGLWNLFKSKQRTIEQPCFVFRTFWNCYLCMMYVEDHFPSFSRIRFSTISGISPSTRPPSIRTCFISVE